MGPKKVQKNAFTFFLEDYVKSEATKGRNISFKIAFEECGPSWKDVPEEKKEVYREKARVYKLQNKAANVSKQTNVGYSYVQMEELLQREQIKKEREDAEVKNTISTMDYESIKNNLFYVIHCNYYCKTAEGIYVPAEISIVEFNLEDGVKQKYHTLINPGPIPLGYGFEAKQNIDDIHDLPLPPYDEGNSDYCGILNDILAILENGILPDGSYPPFFAAKNNIAACENILQALSQNESEDQSFFRVYQIEKMFFWLKNKCVEFSDDESVGFPITANAEYEFVKDSYCFTRGISCEYHTMSDNKYYNCSLSIAQRYVYLICDHCCEFVNVEMIPEKHCPKDCDIDRSKRKELSAQSLMSAQGSYEVHESEFDGQSSYCGAASLVNFRNKESVSLYEKFGSPSSASGGSSVHPNLARPSTSSSSKELRRPGKPESSDSDEEDYPRMSKGRGLRF